MILLKIVYNISFRKILKAGHPWLSWWALIPHAGIHFPTTQGSMKYYVNFFSFSTDA